MFISREDLKGRNRTYQIGEKCEDIHRDQNPTKEEPSGILPEHREGPQDVENCEVFYQYNDHGKFIHARTGSREGYQIYYEETC